MNTNVHEWVHGELSFQIVGAAMAVHNTLGSGFLEKVYENALVIALRKRGLLSQQQFPVPVYYEGEQVGEYFADLLVENKVLLELKAVESLTNIHRAQIHHYLKATGLQLGLLINFANSRLEWERIVL